MRKKDFIKLEKYCENKFYCLSKKCLFRPMITNGKYKNKKRDGYILCKECYKELEK